MMKTPKLKLLITAILISSAAVWIAVENNLLKSESIVIDQSMTKKALESLQEDLQNKDVTLTFSEVTFNAKGFLESVKGEVNYLSSSGTFSTNNLDKIVIVKGILGIAIKVTSQRKVKAV